MTHNEGEKPEDKTGEKTDRVAKTLMEIDIEAVSKLAEAAAKEGSAEQPHQSAEKGKAANEKSKKKERVAKTMLEVDLISLDKLGEALSRDAGETAKQEVEAATNPASIKETAPNNEGIDDVKASAAAVEAAIQAAIHEAEGESPESKAKPRRKLKRVSRTLLEFPMDDLEANRLTPSAPEPEPDHSEQPQMDQAATHDNNFVSPIIGGSLTGSMPMLKGDDLQGQNLDQTRPAGQSAAGENLQTPPPSLTGAEKPKGGTRSIRRARKTDFVCKTMLDHSVLFDTVARTKAKMDAKAMEKIKERLLEPVKPFVPIVCDRKATVCAFKWDDPEPRERFKICSLCQTPVYNLQDLELPEAEAIIFQRENIKKPVLYKRADGKYMTRDCPREAMRRQQQMMMILVGATVAVALLTMMIMFPPPKPTAKSPQTEEANDQPKPIVKRRRKPSSVSNKDGSLHYEAGKPVQENPEAGTTATTGSTGGSDSGAGSGSGQTNQGGAFATFPEPSKTPDNNQGASSSEESGSFWQYSDGQGK